jgi:hypothetical protein
MVWYVVFRGRKSRVYDSYGVYSEYVVRFSGAAFQSYLLVHTGVVGCHLTYRIKDSDMHV